MEKVNWGIIGAGHIASKVIPALKSVSGSVLYACAARDPERAAAFADEFDILKSYGDYDDILADPNVHVVYITTPHMNHAELSIKAMKAGKAVLCEKPCAVNAAQMRKIIATSKETGMFFMEGLWTRFQPAFNETMTLVSTGAIGKIQAISADFCISNTPKAGSRLFEPSLAGGALLDVGIYPLTIAIASAVAATNNKIPFSKMKPSSLQGVCRKTLSKVDGYDSISISFNLPEQPLIATLTASIDTSCGNHFKSARIIGTEGIIHLPNFWYATEINIFNAEGSCIEQRKVPFKVNGYEYEIEEVMRCLRLENEIESPIHSHEDSLSLIEIMDVLRLKWKLIYPFETEDDLGPKATVAQGIAVTPTIKDKASSVNHDHVVIYTDGACSGNPGKGGWGAVVLADGKEHKMSGGEKLTTNNRMELMAAIEALEYVLEHKAISSKQITLYSDSQYVKNGIQTWIYSWKKNGWKTANKDPVKNKDLWIEIDEAVQQLKIEWKWVKGHAGNKYNEMCDTLAVEAGKRQ